LFTQIIHKQRFVRITSITLLELADFIEIFFCAYNSRNALLFMLCKNTFINETINQIAKPFSAKSMIPNRLKKKLVIEQIN
jgi:hypothetical protein